MGRVLPTTGGGQVLWFPVLASPRHVTVPHPGLCEWGWGAGFLRSGQCAGHALKSLPRVASPEEPELKARPRPSGAGVLCMDLHLAFLGSARSQLWFLLGGQVTAVHTFLAPEAHLFWRGT